ncbi:MAG: hypothetical protein ACRBFS_01075 [Aureispira sp.]
MRSPYWFFLLFTLFWSSCDTPYTNIQQTWMLQKRVYKNQRQDDIKMGLPFIFTFTEDSLTNYRLGYSARNTVAYELVEQQEGRSHQLVVTARDSVSRITLQAYTDSLLIYVEEDYSWYQVLKPLKKFQQSYQEERLRGMLNNQVYTLETSFADTSIVFEFLENKQLFFPQWFEWEQTGLSFWLLDIYEGELFFSWENAIGQYQTVQIVAIDDDSIQLWSHEAQAYSTLKKQPLAANKLQKESFIGYWKETTPPPISYKDTSTGKTSFLRPPPPPPPPPPLPYPEADLVRMAITKDSLRTLFFYADRTTPWEISPSGRYWLCRDIIGSGSSRKDRSVLRARFLENDILELEVLKEGSWREKPYTRLYYMKRMSAEEFIESRNR